MNDNNSSLRRGAGGYSTSASSLTALPTATPIAPKTYPNNSFMDPVRQQSTGYTSSYRPYGNDNDTYRSNNSRYNSTGNTRAYSYDDLLNEQNRSQLSTYNARGNNPYGQQQQQQQQPRSPRRDQYGDENDDVIVKSTDLPANYEQEMIELVRLAFRKYEITNQRELAGYLKRSADKTFGPCWHCIVGRQFSSYVTHEMNGFIYFTKGPLSILLFKSGA